MVHAVYLLNLKSLFIHHSCWNGSERQPHGWRTEPQTTLCQAHRESLMNSVTTDVNTNHQSLRTRLG